MAIELISKIKPKNNGGFKLVDTMDIDHKGKGLDEVIASLEGGGSGGVTEERVQTLINEALSWKEVPSGGKINELNID